MPVRWDSTKEMLEKCVIARQPLDAVAMNDMAKYHLSESDWKMVEGCLEFTMVFFLENI